jgi:asparagine synthase (glutamine-hydrolysing)
MNDAKELYPNNPQRQALYFDQHTYLCSLLDRNDRCTMGTSIECREPFLDERLIAGLGTLDDKWFFTGKKGKFILKSAMENKLPSEILNFRKIGLSAPWKDYLLNYPSIKNELEDMINSPIFEIKYLDNVNPKKLIQEFKNGNDKLVPFIMPIFMFHIWHKYYFQKLSKL